MDKQDLLIIILPLAVLTVFLGVSNIKYFIVSYVSIRSAVSIFYDSSIFLGLNLGSLLTGVYCLSLTLWVSGHRNLRYKTSVNSMAVAIFLYSIFSSLFFGEFRLEYLLKLYTGVITIIAFPMVFRSSRDINLLMTAFFIGTLFPALQAISQLLFGVDFGGMKTSQDYSYGDAFTMYYGFYYKYDGYAWAALSGLLVLIYKLYNEKHALKKFVYLGFLGIYIIMVFITLSRTLAVTATIAITGIVVVLMRSGPIRLVGATIIAASAAGVYGISKWSSAIFERSRYEILSIQRGDYGFGLHGRIGLWENKFDAFLDKPLLDKLFGTDIFIGPHGDYVAWLLTYGLVGFLLYISLMGLLLRKVIGRFRASSVSDKHYALGVMALSAQLVWMAGAIIYTPSAYPDFMVLTWGIIAIYLAVTATQNYRKKAAGLELASTLQSRNPEIQIHRQTP